MFSFRTILLGAALTGLIVSGPLTRSARAAEAAAIKMGVVDLQKVITDCQEGKESKKKVQDFYSKRQADLEEAQRSFSQKEEDFLKQKVLLTDEAAQKMSEELERRKVELKRNLEDAEFELESFQNKLFGALKERVVKVVEAYGQKEGYSVIFNKLAGGNVLYADTSTDITPEIVKAFDASGAGAGAVRVK